MIGSLDTALLQQIWWILVAVVGSLFLFLTFVQGGQTLLWQVAKTDTEKSLVINSLGRKWELTFTTLVLFGGALFAAFPKFYATSFGGAYWVWILILFTFIVQAVSYEYRKKPNNLLGARVYELFLFVNGSVGILLIGAAVGTFFTGSNFVLNQFNQVTWTHPLRGLEAAFSLFNLSLGLFLVFNARVLGAMYLVNSIDFSVAPDLEQRLRRACLVNLVCALPFLLYVLGALCADAGLWL
jgi:cytochrome d ubiquinol oxidase subunit II